MGFPSYKVTFKPPGPVAGELKGVVIYIQASGAETAISDARQVLDISPEDLECVEVVRAEIKIS